MEGNDILKRLKTEHYFKSQNF